MKLPPCLSSAVASVAPSASRQHELIRLSATNRQQPEIQCRDTNKFLSDMIDISAASDNRVNTLARPKPFTLSVVVPCFNEQDVLNLMYRRVIEILGERDFALEIVIVDDGSDDRSVDIATELVRDDSRVKLIQLSRNFGHQAALSAGLANSSGDVIAVIDADLQDPPEVILEMVRKWQEGFDVVYGIRTARKEAVLKRACYRLFYRIFQRLADIDAPLDAGDFSLVDRRVLDVINRLPEKNRFFRGLRAWSGFRQTGIRYERQERAAGRSKYSIIPRLSNHHA
jgi:polyisoprenyl-phosphate glycosyltransferase